ncbi:MAG TPA: phage tail protein, partial [Planctomycetota bacterium]|nr:phage tail protein [Planctomycetota bacterium]
MRTGTIEQLYIPAFSSVADNNGTDEALEGPETTDPNSTTRVITVGSSSQSVQDQHFDLYGVGYDLTEEADYVRITISFPQGYYQTGGGNPVGRHWALTIRYIELSSGVPVTTGGDFSDGYVRLPGPLLPYRSTQPFTVTYQFPLYDPQTYTPGVIGTALAGGGGSGGDTTATSFATPWAASQIVPQMTVSCWANFATMTDQSSGNQTACMVDLNTASTNGFRFAIRQVTFTPAPGYQITKQVPVLTLHGAQIAEFHEGTNSGNAIDPSFWLGNPSLTWDPDGTTHHYAFTYAYRALVDGVNDRLRLYVDGQLLCEYLGDILLRAPTGATMHVGRDATTSRNMNGSIDELWLTTEERTPDDIYRDFNAGSGRIGVQGSGIPSDTQRAVLTAGTILGGYHFDSSVGSVTPTFDTVYQNDLTFGGDMNVGGVALINSTGVIANETRRSTYRVEVARNISDSNDTGTIDSGVKLVQVTGFQDAKFTYPTTPLLGLRVHADQEVSGSVPQITALLQGVRCPTWDGQTDTQTTDLPLVWTRNPAWIALDRLINVRYGLGQHFTQKLIDIPSFHEWALYCDEVIYNLRGGRITGTNHATTTDTQVSGLQYDTTVTGQSEFDGRGRIRIFVDALYPPDWKVGAYVGWYDEATVATYVDHNVASATDPGGYEIAYITESPSGTWLVDVFWDREDEGAPWPTGTRLDAHTTIGTPYEGTYEGRMLRHTYDAVHDTAESAWETLQEVGSIGRGILLLEGSRVRAKINRARDPIGVITIASVIEGSFVVEYGGPSERPNAYTVQFLDEDKQHEQGTVYVEHESVQDAANLNQLRNESITVRGITRRAAAARHGKWLVNLDQELFRSGTFRASVDTIHYEVGDVLVVSHDVLDWGLSGRVESTSLTTGTIKLDRDLVIGAGTYYVDVSYPTQNGYATAEINETPGTYVAGSSITLLAALPFVPQVGSRYVAYETSERFLIEIVHTRLSPELEVEVRWAQYVASVYDDTTEDLDPTSVGGTQNITIGSRIPPLLEDVRARELAQLNVS